MLICRKRASPSYSRSWDGQDGKKNYRTEIVADRVQFGPKASGGYQQPTTNNQQPAEENQKGAAEGIEYPKEEINAEDIPF